MVVTNARISPLPWLTLPLQIMEVLLSLVPVAISLPLRTDTREVTRVDMTMVIGSLFTSTLPRVVVETRVTRGAKEEGETDFSVGHDFGHSRTYGQDRLGLTRR